MKCETVSWSEDGADSQDSSSRDLDRSAERSTSLRPSSFVTPLKGVSREFRHKRVTSRQFEDETLNRFDQYEKRKKERILVQKKEMMKHEMEQYTLTPIINKHKKRDLSRNPLVSRLDEILQDRKVGIEKKKERFITRAEAEAKECTFKPNINNGDINRSVDDLFKWQQQKKIRLMEKSIGLEQDQKECRFVPEISAHSKAIMKKRSNHQEFQKVEDRLLSYIKKNKEHDRKPDPDKSKQSDRSMTPSNSRRSAVSQSIAFGRKLMPVNSSIKRSASRPDLSTSDHKSINSKTYKSRNGDQSGAKGLFSFRKGLESQRGGQDKDTPQLYRQQGQHRFEENLPNHDTFRHLGSLADSTLHFEENTFEEIKPAKSSRTAKVNWASNQSDKENTYKPSKPVPSPPQNQHTVTALAAPIEAKVKESHRSLAKEFDHEAHTKLKKSVKSKEPSHGIMKEQLTIKANPTSQSDQEARELRTSKADPIKSLERSMSRSSIMKTPSVQQHLHKAKSTTSNKAAGSAKGSDKPAPPQAIPVPLVKPNKVELTEKYGIKIKKTIIDCQDIRQSVFAGETTSMLQNLKRINTNLKKFNQFECIIKDTKQSDTRSTNAQSSQSIDDPTPHSFMDPGLTPNKTRTPHANPFIEMLEVSGLCPPN